MNSKTRAQAEHEWFHGLNGKPVPLEDVGAAFRAGWDAQQSDLDRLTAENRMLREVIAMTDPCIHQAAVDAQQAHADGRTITLEQYMADRGLQ